MKLTEKSILAPDLSDPAARDASGNLNNGARAQFGRAAVDAGTPDRGLNDDRTDAIDTLANILHWLERLGADPDAAIESAARHFDEERETVEEQAVQILTDAGIAAHLQHTGGGIWVAEACSTTIPGRYIWITNSEAEAEAGGRFLLIAYRDRDDETGIERLSGACGDDQLRDRARRALTAPA